MLPEEGYGIIIDNQSAYDDKQAYPSSSFASRFAGVRIHPELDAAHRRSMVNAFVEFYHLLERMGWYDHTGDWDFHVGVKLYDGRQHDHFGDGAIVHFVTGDRSDIDADETKTHNEEDRRGFLKIEAPLEYDEPNYEYILPADRQPFPEFFVGSDDDDDGYDGVWMVPIENISEIGFGWCS